MVKISYPERKPAIKIEDGKEKIFCIIRKKWLFITPEEWVRQNFILFLIDEMHFPASLIAVEKKIKVGAVEKRFDIVLYNQQTLPFIIVECKEMNVTLSQETLQQVLRYNMEINAPYLIITNGSFTHVYKHEGLSFLEMDFVPNYQ